MPFKKKELSPVVETHDDKIQKIKKLKKELDEQLDLVYSEIGEKYGFEKNTIIKIHKKIIYQYV
jgi:tetrahydromethanopterin S-methyltransferase subunit G